MFVTTVEKTNDALDSKAAEIGHRFSIPYIKRNKKTIHQLRNQYGSLCMVVGKARTELYGYHGDKPLFFHPNMAAVRMKRLAQGEKDPLIEVTQLSGGMSVLDCTMGLATDALIMSHIAGPDGSVTALEANPIIHYIISEGLKHYSFENTQLKEAANRIKTVHVDHLHFLAQTPDQSFDIVYLDPMFTTTISESNAVQSLSSFACQDEILPESIFHAKRIARKRVVLKDHFKSERFSFFHFHVQIRKSAKFHYGYIELN